MEKGPCVASNYLSSGCVLDEAYIQCLRNFTKEGYEDFFVDIGSSFGLYSIQNKDFFKSFFFIEPNPIVFHLLNANVRVDKTLYEKSVFFNIGLGHQSGTATLYSSRKEVSLADSGCGFIAQGNDYFNHDNLNKEEFNTVDITVEKASEFFETLWPSLKEKKGLFKIDVEGLEMTVLSAISEKIIPKCDPKMLPIIFFECWDLSQHVKTIKTLFPSYSLAYLYQNTRQGSMFKNLCAVLMEGKIDQLVEVREEKELQTNGNFFLIPHTIKSNFL